MSPSKPLEWLDQPKPDGFNRMWLRKCIKVVQRDTVVERAGEILVVEVLRTPDGLCWRFEDSPNLTPVGEGLYQWLNLHDADFGARRSGYLWYAPTGDCCDDKPATPTTTTGRTDLVEHWENLETAEEFSNAGQAINEAPR